MKPILNILLATLCLSQASLHADDGAKPNIVLFYMDDLSAGLIGCYGGGPAPTPNIDSIAKNGVRFTDGYVTACSCSPSRAGLMSGQYQSRFGHDSNQDATPGMDLKTTLLPQRLKQEGYTTAIIGKWHLGEGKEYLPVSRGFDHSFGSVANLDQDRKTKKSTSNYYEADRIITSPGLQSDEYLISSPLYAKKACEFIDQHHSKPFFLYLPFNAAHAPAVSSDHWKEKMTALGVPKELLHKAAQMGEMDEAIGTVLTKLRTLAIEDKTIIFCIADNGRADDSGGPDGGDGSLGMKGGKWQLYEAGIRVPWLMQWKGHIPANQVITTPVIQLDIAPTVLKQAGIQLQPEWGLDGEDLLPLVTGKTQTLERHELYWRVDSDQMAIRRGPWKLVRTAFKKAPELYDLSKDLGETKNLATEHPDTVKELQSLWDTWNQDMKPVTRKPRRSKATDE
jgi:arylsulfatase A-like enzyme